MQRVHSDPPSPPPAVRDDEAVLLARIAAGDREAFAALYRRYRRPLAAYLARVTGRLEEVDELVDDTLLVVWNRAASFAGRSRPSTWIFGIAYRKALKSLERRSRRAGRRQPRRRRRAGGGGDAGGCLGPARAGGGGRHGARLR